MELIIIRVGSADNGKFNCEFYSCYFEQGVGGCQQLIDKNFRIELLRSQ